MYRFLTIALTASLLIGSSFLSEAAEKDKEASPSFSKRKKVSLLEKSTILQNKGKLAMIPKGSIVFLPEHLKSKIVSNGAPKGKLVHWQEFLSSNGSWIHMFPISFEQATGEKKVDQEQFKSLQKLGKIVIAHQGGNLITISPKALEPPVEEEN